MFNSINLQPTFSSAVYVSNLPRPEEIEYSGAEVGEKLKVDLLCSYQGPRLLIYDSYPHRIDYQYNPTLNTKKNAEALIQEIENHKKTQPNPEKN